jgi:hypothetical protein
VEPAVQLLYFEGCALEQDLAHADRGDTDQREQQLRDGHAGVIDY